MPRTISVVVDGDVRLQQVRAEARDAFRGVSLEADRAADDIGSAFGRVDEDLRRSFSGLDDDLSREFGSIGDSARTTFGSIDLSASRSADSVASSFDGIEDEVGRSFAGVGQRVGRELQGIEDEADSAFSDVDRSADRAATSIGGSFDGVEDQIAADLAGIGSRVQRELSDIPPPRVEDRIVPPFRRAGEEAGEELSAGIERGIGALDADAVGSNIVDGLSSLGAKAGPIGAVAVTIGGVFGDELATGISSTFNSRRNNLLFSLTNGLSAADLGPIGRAAGQAYAAGLGDSLADVRQTTALLQNELASIDDGFDLSETTRQAEALDEVFGVSLPQSIEVARRLVANDLVDDSTEAFNLIGQTAQEYRLDFEEILEVASEFSPVFSKLGIDGATAFDIIGTSVQQGLLPNVDRAAELFEEFNIRLSETDTLREPVQRLGLDLQTLQQQLANGQGADALTDIADALLAIEDPAQRNALALDIFGASIESASDPQQVIQLLATADAIGEVGSQASDAADLVEEADSALAKLGRGAEGLGRILGDAFEGLASAVLLDFSGFNEAMREGREEIVKVVDLIPFLDVEIPEPPTEQFERLAGGVTESFGAFNSLGVAAGEASSEVNTLTGEVTDLDGALSAFAGRFNEDQIFRSIEADAAAAIEATAGLTESSFSLADGFDTTTEAGANAEAALENLSGNLDDLIRAQQDGSIGAAELAAGQADVRAAVADVAAQMNITEAEAAALISKYSDFPPEVVTDIIAKDLASQSIAEVARQVNLIPRNVLITVNRKINFSGFADTFEDGGITDGGQGFGGERGPELVQFGNVGHKYTPAEVTADGLPGQWSTIGTEGPGFFDVGSRARIYSTAESERLIEAAKRIPRMASGGVSFSERLAIVGDNPNATVDPEITAPQSFIEDALRKVLSENGRRGPFAENLNVTLAEGENMWETLELTEQLYSVAI